jgi:ribulose-phosphate 3-epimerase
MNRITKVVPAILTEDPQALKSMVRQTATFTDYAQIDIMDGLFVPSKSITWEHLHKLKFKFKWEAHLMVQNPENYIEGFQKAGASRIIFHYEATPSPEEVVSKARNLGVEVGLAINPETQVSAFLHLVQKVDTVLFLTVNPGFYGSKFIPEVLNKIELLHSTGHEIEIGVDGGIKENNILDVAQAGADLIYVGSAIFLQPDPAESYKRLANLIEQKHR